MTLASFPMTSISSKAHKIDFSYFLFTVDATFLYYVQSRNLAEKISIPAELVVPVRVTQTLFIPFFEKNVTIKWLPQNHRCTAVTTAVTKHFRLYRASNFQRQGALLSSCERVESTQERPLLRLICIFNHSPDTCCPCVCHYQTDWNIFFSRDQNQIRFSGFSSSID